MKFNKWTLGLAAVGAISMASAVSAEEQKMAALNTVVPATVISGYVDVAAQYNAGNYSTSAGLPAGLNNGKVDSFSLNSFDVALDKPQDETPWASGYHAEINYGLDAVGVGFGSGLTAAVRQGYVALRTPVGNGIDWKVGAFDDIIGYEGNSGYSNPNYTRSIGYSVEPTTLVGAIGSYKATDSVAFQLGLANTTISNEKTIAAAVAFTAPDSFGWAKGATLNLGTLLNVDKNGQDNWYAGLTLPTPYTALKFGAALDVVSVNNAGVNNAHNDSGWVAGLYASLQATEKLSFNLRGEVFDMPGHGDSYAPNYNSALVNPSNYQRPYANGGGEELTATLQYNLWANVVSRFEARWDHIDSGSSFAIPNGTVGTKGYYPNGDAFVLAVNLVYTF